MDSYQLADIVGTLCILAGLAVGGIAFLVPQGWRSPLGLLMLCCGVCILAASVIHSPAGPTYSKLVVARALAMY